MDDDVEVAHRADGVARRTVLKGLGVAGLATVTVPALAATHAAATTSGTRSGVSPSAAAPGVPSAPVATSTSSTVAPSASPSEQTWLRETEDFKEGVKSYAEKRPGNWKGR